LTQAFVDWLKPRLAVISVGKNTYGQPAREAVDMLQSVGSKVLRTDKQGDIEVVSDGKNWRAL
jgi:competence protein ComEC